MITKGLKPGSATNRLGAGSLRASGPACKPVYGLWFQLGQAFYAWYDAANRVCQAPSRGLKPTGLSRLPPAHPATYSLLLAVFELFVPVLDNADHRVGSFAFVFYWLHENKALTVGRDVVVQLVTLSEGKAAR
jgi:hypothetical protein